MWPELLFSRTLASLEIILHMPSMTSAFSTYLSKFQTRLQIAGGPLCVWFFVSKIRPQDIRWSAQRKRYSHWLRCNSLHVPCSAGALHFAPRQCLQPQGNARGAKILSNNVISTSQKYLSFLSCCYKMERNYIYQNPNRVYINKEKTSKQILDLETSELHLHPHSLSSMHPKWKMSALETCS